MRGSDLDGRSDVYSLGLVLYEMLTGRLPFAADNPQALLVQRLQVEPMPLNRARPGLTFSPEVSGLVMKALERERGNRYRSAGEMERAIAALLDSWRAARERQERLAASQVQRRPVGGTTREKSDGSRSRLLAYGLGCFAALAVLVFFVARDKGQKPVPKVEPQVTQQPAPANSASLPKTEPAKSSNLGNGWTLVGSAPPPKTAPPQIPRTAPADESRLGRPTGPGPGKAAAEAGRATAARANQPDGWPALRLHSSRPVHDGLLTGRQRMP